YQFVAHTVAEEVAHGLTGPVAETVAHALAEHRLAHLAAQDPFRLSGGEKRRLSLAGMLAHARPCLLADEPTPGLDRRDTVAAMTTLRRAADGGKAVVLSSHDLRTVATVADRVVVLAEGTVVADGPTAAVLGDRDVLRRAGLRLPPLVAWLLEHAPAAARRVLGRLDSAAAEPVPVGAASCAPHRWPGATPRSSSRWSSCSRLPRCWYSTRSSPPCSTCVGSAPHSSGLGPRPG